MSDAAGESEDHAAGHRETHSSEQPALMAIAAALGASLSSIVDDTLKLLALEGRLAALSLTAMLAGAAVTALLIVSAWLFALAAVAVWLVESGVAWQTAFLVVASVNVVAALALAYAIRRLSRNLLFQSTRRSLRTRPSERPVDARTDAP